MKTEEELKEIKKKIAFLKEQEAVYRERAEESGRKSEFLGRLIVVVAINGMWVVYLLW